MRLWQEIDRLSAAEVISWAVTTYGPKFAIATGFQKEGLVLVDMAWRAAGGGNFRVFTLDTGRLPEETYQVIESVRERYGTDVEVVFPDRDAVEAMVSLHGPNLFYLSQSLRAHCCDIRKVKPMRRKLLEVEAWASGLRRDQSETRARVRVVEEIDGRIRLCPLAEWSAAQVDEYIQAHQVPVHPLYSRGYTSIGCAPCTRAVAAGEDTRAGRWWWEDGLKECGIHYSPDGTVTRDA